MLKNDQLFEVWEVRSSLICYTKTTLELENIFKNGKKEKLLDKLKNSPNNITFSDISKLLKLEGFILDRITGSHHIFVKENIVFVIPVHRNRVRSVYVKRVIELIEGE